MALKKNLKLQGSLDADFPSAMGDPEFIGADFIFPRIKEQDAKYSDQFLLNESLAILQSKSLLQLAVQGYPAKDVFEDYGQEYTKMLGTEDYGLPTGSFAERFISQANANVLDYVAKNVKTLPADEIKSLYLTL